jgi:hypothetical protein
MEQSPSWEANRFEASQEISRVLLNPKVHYRIHNCSPPVTHLSQPNLVHNPTSHFLMIHMFVTSRLFTLLEYSLTYNLRLAHRNYSKLHNLYYTYHLLIVWLLSTANIGILDKRTHFYFGSRLWRLPVEWSEKIWNNKLYVIHDPCFNRLYKVMAPQNTHKYTEFSFIRTMNSCVIFSVCFCKNTQFLPLVFMCKLILVRQNNKKKVSVNSNCIYVVYVNMKWVARYGIPYGCIWIVMLKTYV